MAGDRLLRVDEFLLTLIVTVMYGPTLQRWCYSDRV
jgi:hypothetical protein